MITPARFHSLTAQYPQLRIAVLGDFCLDRYLEIDPEKREISIETGLEVRNVVQVRSQPGGAGTILNNLVALGMGAICPLGFAGEDGEGFELRRALAALPGVSIKHFLSTTQRRTFTYTKPLLMRSGKPPEELNRLDLKNWTPTPGELETRIGEALRALVADIDALIILDQVDLPETGVVTAKLLEQLRQLIQTHPHLLILADSRRGLRGYPPVGFKMNRAELAALTGVGSEAGLSQFKDVAAELARRQGRHVFVTLAEAGMLGAAPDGKVEHVPALPVRGPIDIVGAGDAVTANLAAALASGANVREALELASAAASIVIHQLGTTGTASVAQIKPLLS